MSVRIDSMTIPGAPIEGVNPIPMFRRMKGFGLYETAGAFPPEVAQDLGNATRVLPYRVQDRYSRQRNPVALKTVVLENEYLKATFTPEYGGKLWSLYDKENHRELLMANPVLQPCNLAVRNAWLSGGIEWNFGAIGHTYFTCDNVWSAVLRDGTGEEFLRIWEFERAKECLWQADFHLPQGSRQLYSHIRVCNPTGEDTTTYWWTNIAIPEDGGTRVLSSSEMVVVVCGGHALTYEKLPYLSVMPGDLSYPKNATRSFDYFFQPREGVRTTWEGGVNLQGETFYDRSTAPLVYHKMFCWGNHRAGSRWQDFLSQPGQGNYIEIQAGFARSQLHDKRFPAGETLEWTQCYGGAKLDPTAVHGVTLEEADAALGAYVDGAIPEETLLEMDRRFREDASRPVSERQIVHYASGWGALEAARRAAVGESALPSSVCFPQGAGQEETQPWLRLLREGVLPETDPDRTPVSWMTSVKWLALLEQSLTRPGGCHWESLLHYGNMLFEAWDNTKIAAEAVNWPDKEVWEFMAEKAWLESVSHKPSAWAYRNLAVLEHLRGNNEKAEAYYDKVFAFDAAKRDFAFAAEYMGWLNAAERYEKAWALYVSLPEPLKAADRMMLRAAVCAIRLEKLDFIQQVFQREYADIREGETSLTDIWFEYCARKLAKERGIDASSTDALAELWDEAWDTCPPPEAIDFRMSYDRKNKYRVQAD